MEIIVDATEKVQLQLTMDKMYLQIVKTLVNLIEDRDAYTATHSMQVHDLAIAIGKELNLPKTNLADKIGVASILHYIGKIGIPERILNKPGKLLNSEFKIMEKHCLMGYNSLKDIKSLHDVAEFILHHHENFNGSGYPDGLKGTDIPIVSRIIRVADVYSALTTNRAYRPAMQREQALKIIVDGKYKDFDPAVVNALLKVIKKGVSRERLASSR
jgi:HD-GYP domain-containing protein (c-di-GMP phosphodiesterase class II)